MGEPVPSSTALIHVRASRAVLVVMSKFCNQCGSQLVGEQPQTDPLDNEQPSGPKNSVTHALTLVSFVDAPNRLLRLEPEGVARLSPGAKWRAGMFKRTMGQEGDPVVRVTWHDAEGRPSDADFPM